jgi:hypothetical protein
MARIATLLLVGVTLAFAAQCPAHEGAGGDDPPAADPAASSPASTDNAAADAATPRVSHHHPARRLTVVQSIDESVHRLARGLDLDAGQQDRVREILVDQHLQMMRLRSGGATASDNMAGAMLSIYDQTRVRIRAILTDEQLQKYPAAVPRDQTAAGQADLQKWLKMQENKRKQDGGSSQ